MKLYLSSQHIGCAPYALLEIVGSNRKVGVIANAIDAHKPQHRVDRVYKEIERLNNLGFDAEELDLREYFGRTKALRSKLERLGTIWVRGGNVFTLVRAMEQSGFSEIAPALIRTDRLVFAGYSAATIIAAPDLFGSELIDNPNELPDGYQNQNPPHKALGLTDHYIACHHGSNQPWAVNVSRYIDYVTGNGKSILKLSDGDVYIVDGSGKYVILREDNTR